GGAGRRMPAPGRAEGAGARPAPRSDRRHRLGMLVVGSDDRRATRHDEVAEQPELGGEIGFECRVVVEVVAAEIGEAAGFYAHAVETVLVEPVRGRFHGEGGNALVGKHGERGLQLDRPPDGWRTVYPPRRAAGSDC